jgi:hypothetical protein
VTAHSSTAVRRSRRLDSSDNEVDLFNALQPKSWSNDEVESKEHAAYAADASAAPEEHICSSGLHYTVQAETWALRHLGQCTHDEGATVRMALLSPSRV